MTTVQTRKQSVSVIEAGDNIVLVRPLTRSTRQWLEDNVVDPQWWGGSLVVHPSCLLDLLAGLGEINQES